MATIKNLSDFERGVSKEDRGFVSQSPDLNPEGV
jgi:hypothetical protein